MIDKETQAAPFAWFAKDDIDARSEAAYHRHSSLFDSAQHQHTVSMVKQICRKHFSGYNMIYETCRAQSRRRPANTEVKFAHVVLGRKFNRTVLEKELTAIGIHSDMIINKSNTGSFSVHVA